MRHFEQGKSKAAWGYGLTAKLEVLQWTLSDASIKRTEACTYYQATLPARAICATIATVTPLRSIQHYIRICELGGDAEAAKSWRLIAAFIRLWDRAVKVRGFNNVTPN